MENAEEIFNYLEDFSKRKPKTIPQELNDYLAYVARTGDPVYQWSLVKSLFKEKLLSVITDFYETSPGIDIPPYPNVDPFNFDVMKNSLLERFDTFTSAPFTVQRICELLTCPRNQYNRVDKYMRAIEKNILVVSTREPGSQRQPEPENGEPPEPIVNGSDNNSEYNVDVEMEDMSWKDASDNHDSEPQPGSSESHISVDDIEARLKAKQETMDIQEKTTEYESVTPPEPNITNDEQISKSDETPPHDPPEIINTEEKMDISSTEVDEKSNIQTEINTQTTCLVIPEIKVEDVEMTERRLKEEVDTDKSEKPQEEEKEPLETEVKTQTELTSDENSSDSKDGIEKVISDVSTSSEESSSSDNTDCNSNSPKPDVNEEIPLENVEYTKDEPQNPLPVEKNADTQKVSLESDNYSISDVNSVLPQPQVEEIEQVKDEPVAQENAVEDKKEIEPEIVKEEDNVDDSKEKS